MSVNLPESRPNITVDFDPDEIQIVVQSLRKVAQDRQQSGGGHGKFFRLAKKISDAIKSAGDRRE